MKRLLQLTTWGLFAICISAAAIAQQKPQQKPVKPKEPTKEKPAKDKLEDYDEIIIKRKGEKGGKVTVEIKGEEVFVNGKPLAQYDDDNISVRKRDVMVWDGNTRTMMGTSASPFRYNVSGEKAFLGVVTEQDDKGAKISDVTDNSAADKAGLKEGDVIIRVNETKIENHEQLSKAISKQKPEEKVTIVYLRDGKEQKAVATLGKTNFTGTYSYTMPKMAAPSQDFNFDFDHNGMSQSFYSPGRGRIGIRAQDTEEGKGVKVLDVGDESLAEKAGLKEGDIITEFDGKPINSADELAEAARGSREKSTISVKYTRDGKAQTAEIKIPKKLKTTNL